MTSDVMTNAGQLGAGKLTATHRGEHQEDIAAPLTASMLAAMTPGWFRERGCCAVRLIQPVSFGTGTANAEFEVRFIRFLRESLSCLLTVKWSLGLAGSIDVGAVCHLPPPTARAAGMAGLAALAGRRSDQPQADQWRAEYGFGHCFYRVGPGFIHVVDVRDADDAARFLLDDPATVEAFGLLADAVQLSALPPLARELADQLEDARLLFRIGDWATLLPYRLRRWPMPCTAV
jgi:Family of unknown function (DUF5825)